ncbi:hypothetical protein [Novosphingobium naphthalenivorans]|uniref:hypothetical protein n=1 Tax=Novosphingobium naphthalenivorans TaxID=273168 RepID=UPI000831FFF1|nr:hypothetical protein [Novosphingobium naphthalenivorans]
MKIVGAGLIVLGILSLWFAHFYPIGSGNPLENQLQLLTELMWWQLGLALMVMGTTLIAAASIVSAIKTSRE